jgi:ribosomal protein S18 acetylase RimI-like enzyme
LIRLLEKGTTYLRFFVVDKNEPAINLYRKNSFEKADGIYDEITEDDHILHEFGFEIKTAILLPHAYTLFGTRGHIAVVA